MASNILIFKSLLYAKIVTILISPQFRSNRFVMNVIISSDCLMPGISISFILYAIVIKYSTADKLYFHKR